MPNYTRKKRREEPVKPIETYTPTVFDKIWINHIQQGKLFFNTMLYSINFMFDGETSIKHFDIQPAYYGTDVDELKEVYSDEIQKELVPWIKNEYEEGRLTNYIYWKTSRGAEYHDVYFGYRKMFQYNQLYYQLSISLCCENCDNCKYCERGENRTHFELLYYGINEYDEHSNTYSANRKFVQPDMMMTERYWKSAK